MMLSPQEIVVVYKKSPNDEQNLMKICDKNGNIVSDIIELPQEISEISALNSLKFSHGEMKKKYCFISSGCFFTSVKIYRDENYSSCMSILGVYQNEEHNQITCLASCSSDNENSYSVFSGDDKGKIKKWRFSVQENEVLEEDQQFVQLDTEIAITSIAFSHRFEYMAAGNSISEYKIWSFPSGQEIKVE